MSRHRTISWRHGASLAGSHGRIVYSTRMDPLVVLLSRLVEYSPSIGHKLHKDQNMTIRPILGEYSTSLDSNITNGSILVEYTIRPCDPASEAPCRQELVPFRGESSSTLGCLQRHASRARVAMTNQVLTHPLRPFILTQHALDSVHVVGGVGGARCGPCRHCVDETIL